MQYLGSDREVFRPEVTVRTGPVRFNEFYGLGDPRNKGSMQLISLEGGSSVPIEEGDIVEAHTPTTTGGGMLAIATGKGTFCPVSLLDPPRFQ